MAKVSCRMLHHGAAAASSSKAVICIPSQQTSLESSEIVYASHAILNIARCNRLGIRDFKEKEQVWNVYQTLRTESKGSSSANSTVATATAKRVITCVSQLKNRIPGSEQEQQESVLICGFSDGTITAWRRQQGRWEEKIIAHSGCEQYDGRSITDIGGLHDGIDSLAVATCSSSGADYYSLGPGGVLVKFSMITHTAGNAVRFHTLHPGSTLILIGTAAPRHNKIHVFVDNFPEAPRYCGPLTGHEDWITCFDWFSAGDSDILASGSQDAKIRLWEFSKSSTAGGILEDSDTPVLQATDNGSGDDNDDGDNKEFEEDMDEEEARLEIFHNYKVVSVTLEALLIGHEERVTAVAWHPDPKPIYGQDLILLSSSMDRTIFIWSEHESGIWTPVSRVGSAGGILGGPIGSTLLGFLNVLVEPIRGDWLLGHGYGGALHFFTCGAHQDNRNDRDDGLSIEERAALVPWRAQPCLTGHFDSVTDLSWEAACGEYLITVGNDQTCRIWMPLPVVSSHPEANETNVWIEIARPQVHGYDLSAVTSLSTPNRPHTIISGADEKEIRVFDATQDFTRLLKDLSVESVPTTHDNPVERVERAYIPSLGLSNKASAADGAEEDTARVSESGTLLPLERDLGSVSIWPEVLKLYGHTTEVARLASTLSARSAEKSFLSSKFVDDVLLASTAKARTPDDACIRIWDVPQKKCVQILSNAHRSTVAAICFSPDGKYLASSGKDRRLCLWQRCDVDPVSNQGISPNFLRVDSLDSAHKRIVWSVHFCPLDPTILATGSRDGSVKIWKVMEGGEVNTETKLKEVFYFSPFSKQGGDKPEAVTALSFAPVDVPDGGILALGLECGAIELWKVPLTSLSDGGQPELMICFPLHLCHIAAVSKLSWRPARASQSDNGLVLASCSLDHGCRIYGISTVL